MVALQVLNSSIFMALHDKNNHYNNKILIFSYNSIPIFIFELKALKKLK